MFIAKCIIVVGSKTLSNDMFRAKCVIAGVGSYHSPNDMYRVKCIAIITTRRIDRLKQNPPEIVSYFARAAHSLTRLRIRVCVTTVATIATTTTFYRALKTI
jgi:hypothetical protein